MSHAGDRQRTRFIVRAAHHVTAAALMTACGTQGTTAPTVIGQGNAARLHPLAFTADINTRTRTISITPPTMSVAGGPTLAIDGTDGPALSLLAGDAVRLLVSNYQASAIGAYTPNRIRVSFDVVIANRLPSVGLVTPTWPTPPAAGVILFPIDYTATLAPGAVIGGNGSTLVVEQPRFGAVTPSADFNGTGATGSGSPYNFFNDSDCSAATSNDCFRWKAYDTRIAPLAESSHRTIGFDIDPSVAQFRARMIVAADLSASTEVVGPRVDRRGTASQPANQRIEATP